MIGDRPREGELAWDLVELVRDRLTNEERHTAFVHLGVGDYPPVFRCVLEVVARERYSLPQHLVTLLHEWLEVYDRHREFEPMLVRAIGPEGATVQ